MFFFEKKNYSVTSIFHFYMFRIYFFYFFTVCTFMFEIKSYKSAFAKHIIRFAIAIALCVIFFTTFYKLLYNKNHAKL